MCKETIEHLLLSAGEAQSHHHYAGDESTGAGCVYISFVCYAKLKLSFGDSPELPLVLNSITFISLLGCALFFLTIMPNLSIVNLLYWLHTERNVQH
jgi:hypothetical protein